MGPSPLTSCNHVFPEKRLSGLEAKSVSLSDTRTHAQETEDTTEARAARPSEFGLAAPLALAVIGDPLRDLPAIDHTDGYSVPSNIRLKATTAPLTAGPGRRRTTQSCGAE